MTNTADTTPAANNMPAANNAGLTANQLANNAAAEKAYNAAIARNEEGSGTATNYGSSAWEDQDPDAFWSREPTTNYGSSTYNTPQAPTTNYGSSTYNTPQAPTTNYGSAEPYVPPKFVTPDKSILQHDRIEIKEYDSVITDRKLDIPKINPMPEIPVPLPGCGIGCIPELKLP